MERNHQRIISVNFGYDCFVISERKILHSQTMMNNHSSEKRIATEKVLSSLAHEAALEAIGQRKTHSNSNSPALSMFNSTSVPSLTYSLGKYTSSVSEASLLATNRHLCHE